MRPARGSTLAAVAVAGAAWTACGGGDPEGPPAAEPTPDPQAFSVRDSAGVRIAESRDSSWTAATAWTVEAEPSLQIGSRGGESPGTGFGMVGPVVRLGDGRIAVGDQQAREVRVFSADGAFLGAWGGPGQGPGELQRIERMAALPGDSLAVRNEGLLRHEVFAPDGSYARTVTAPPMEWRTGGWTVTGWMGDGSFVVGSSSVQTTPAFTPGRHVLDAEWHRFDATGGHLGLLAALPERLVEVRGTPPRPDAVSYAPMARAATTASGLWHAFPTAWELRHVGPDGLDRIVRRAWTPEPVTEALRASYQEWYDGGWLYSEVPDAIRHEYVTLRRAASVRASRGDPEPPLAFADTLPAFADLVVSRDGHLWLEAYAPASDLLAGGPARVATGRWTVLDPEGRWLGTVVMPEGLRITEIGADYVLGVWQDELEVPFVRLHRIVKP